MHTRGTTLGIVPKKGKATGDVALWSYVIEVGRWDLVLVPIGMPELDYTAGK